MQDSTQQEAVKTGSITMAPSASEMSASIRRMNELAFQGLMPMYNEDARLYCYRLKRQNGKLVQEGISPRYTAMTLLGLSRLEAMGVASPVDIHESMDVLLKDTKWIDNIGDLGLLIWLCAMTQPDRLNRILNQFDVKQAMARDHAHNTMELAWLLAGLAHQALAEGGGRRDLTAEATETYRLLRSNQGNQGIFSHSARKNSVSGVIRGRIGSFADQIYPVYAMAKASQAYPLEKAADRALDCALTLCQAQGPQGQWWWHYDSSSGNVCGCYPVYSVHQHGMGPMGLFALGEALQSDFSPWIFKGLEWINGDNEIDQDMQDPAAKMIWRCISQGNYRRYLRTALTLLRHREDGPSHDGLDVLYECRPYEFGWLLYAFGNYGLE